MKNLKQISLFLVGMTLSGISLGQKIQKQPELSNGSKIEISTVKSSEKTELNSTNKKESTTKKSKSILNSEANPPKLSQSDKKKEEQE